MLSANIKKYCLIIAGSLVWSLTMVKNGVVYSYGMGFWGPNGHDGVWHISLINSLAQGSLSLPIYAGEYIKNYHLGFDLLLAGIHKLTSIPVTTLYFQIIPPVFALLIGWLTYEFVYLWKKSHAVSLWAVFFTYFGGSLGWIFGQGESLFWAQQSISTLVNPPYALSLIVLLSGLIFLQKNKTLPAILMFALLPQIKIYAGILALGGLLCAGIIDKKIFRVFLFSLILSIALYLPLNSLSSQLVVVKPLWFLDTLFVPDRLDWPRFFSALNTYSSGGIWYKAIPAYAFALLVFLIGNSSLRIIGLLAFIELRKKSWPEWFMSSVVIGGILAPMLFIQKGTSWNTIQFFYYSQFFLGILLALIIVNVLSRHSKPISIPIAALIIISTLPTTREALNHYLPSRPPAMVATDELAALNFLSLQPPGIVLSYPYDKQAAQDAQKNPPRPLYLYESTAYVSAFSGHPVFLEDEVNLNITGFDPGPRRIASLEFFSTTDTAKAGEFLKQNHISYIYIADVKQFRPRLSASEFGFRKIFTDSQSAIWAKD